MASFSQTVICKYGIKSFHDTKNTYDWIIKAIYKRKMPPTEISLFFQFKIGGISCSCKTLEEFVENAYGASGYSLTKMRVSTHQENNNSIYISVDYSNEVYVDADSRQALEEMVRLLDSTSLGEEEVNNLISMTYIEHQDNSVTVNGDSNVVANNQSTIMDKQEKSESKTSNWIQGICQGVLANLTWWILGVVAVALLAWAISNGYISG